MLENLEQFILPITFGGVVLFVAFFVRSVLYRLLQERTPRARMFSDLTWLAIIVIGLGILVYLLGVDPAIILIVGTLVGTTASFAFTEILQQWLSQGRIAFDQHVKPGDLITTSDHFGKVREITSSALIIETPEMDLVIIPASQVVEAELINHTAIAGTPLKIRIPILDKGIADRRQIQKILYEIAFGYKNRLRGEEYEPKVVHSIEAGEVWTIEIIVEDQFDPDPDQSAISLAATTRLEKIGVTVGERLS